MKGLCTVDEGKFADELERINLHVELERERQIVANYESGLAHYHQSIEEMQHQLGRLDERLGS